MALGNMHKQGVRHLIAYCLNDSCRHQALIDVSKSPGDSPVPWFQSRVKCGKCGRRGRWVDVRPNWKEAPGTIDDWSGRPAMPSGGVMACWRVEYVTAKRWLSHGGTGLR